MFHNNIVKISEQLIKRNFLKICLKLPTLHISAWFASIFTMGKGKIFDFLKTNVLNETFLCIGSYKMYDKCVALNHDNSLQIYFFCVNSQTKKDDFLKAVESTVVPKYLTSVQKYWVPDTSAEVSDTSADILSGKLMIPSMIKL